MHISVTSVRTRYHASAAPDSHFAPLAQRESTRTVLRVVALRRVAFFVVRPTVLNQIHRAEEYVRRHRLLTIHPRFELSRARPELAS